MRTATILAMGLLLVGGMTACGNSTEEDPSVASGGGASATASYDPAKYTKCMRDNGMEWFPDVTGSDTNVDVPENVDEEKLNAAVAACRKFLPAGADANQQDSANLTKALKYAKCMRENGLPDYPDPPADGKNIGLKKSDGIDIHSQTFKTADKKCHDLLGSGE